MAEKPRKGGSGHSTHRRKGSPRTARIERFAPILLIAACLIAYHNAFRGPFVLDDLYAIPANESIRSLSTVLAPPAQTPVAGRPLVNLSLAVNYAIGGLNPTSYHVLNVILHALAALALFGIVRRTLSSPGLKELYRDRAGGLATAVALLWAVHPLATEAVDYTIQRTELLMSLFLLLTLYCALRGFEAPKKPGWHVAALVAFALGMASKEVIVVAPFVVLACEWLFWPAPPGEARKRRLRLYGGFAAVLLVSILFIATRFQRTFVGLTGRDVTPWDYLLTQTGVILHYLRLAVWPSPLVGDYADWRIATSVREVLPSFAAVVALASLTVWGLVRRRKLAFLGVFFFLVLGPTSSVRPILTEVAAERRMYLPLAAVVALVVIAGDALLRRVAAPRTAAATAVTIAAVVLAFATIRRNEDYRTTLGFWSDIVAKRPDNPRARSWLGSALHDLGRDREALEQLTASIRLDPRDATARYNLGVVLASQGRTDEAIASNREAIRLNPEYPQAHSNLASALEKRGDLDGAVRHYREAIRIDPRYAIGHYNLAVVLRRQGRNEDAIRHLEEALRWRPEFPEARRTLDSLRAAVIPPPPASPAFR